MDTPTTQVTLDRETAEVTLGALRAWNKIAMELPELFRQGDALRIGSAEVLLTAALDRLSYLETKKQPTLNLRDRLAAHIAYPASPKGW